MSNEQMIISNQVEQPRAPIGSVTLPCGLIDGANLITTALVREIRGHEEDLLGSDKVKPIDKLTEIIARCTVKLGDRTEPGFIQRAASEMTVGDRSVLILAIRRFTLGDVYPFQDVCPNPNCKLKSLYQVDLSTLEQRPMEDPMRRVYDVNLPSGGTARFHVMTGLDEARIAKFQTDQLSQSLLARLELLNGNSPLLADVKRLDMRDRNALRDAFEEVEGGLDTSIQMQCPECQHEFERDLDIGQQGFFFPSRTRKRSKKSSSS